MANKTISDADLTAILDELGVIKRNLRALEAIEGYAVLVSLIEPINKGTNRCIYCGLPRGAHHPACAWAQLRDALNARPKGARRAEPDAPLR